MRFFQITCTNESKALNRFYIVEIEPGGYVEPEETKGLRFKLRRECKDQLFCTFNGVKQKPKVFVLNPA